MRTAARQTETDPVRPGHGKNVQNPGSAMQIYFLGIIPGKSVDNFLEVYFYMGGCSKAEEKKGHTVYVGCSEITRKKGHTVNTEKRLSKNFNLPIDKHVVPC